MAMSYRTRKMLCLVVLVIGLPAYIITATTLVSVLDRPHILVETAIYLGLGVAWALPLKSLFRGIGREDPDKTE
ncbi:MAG: DUF2842 domain-containing protein [Pseudomonadota bacterium]